MLEVEIPWRTVEALLGKDLPRFEREVGRIIEDSLRARGMRNVTTSEVRRRVNFCVKATGEMRRALGWPTERIVDQLPAALKAFIDGQPWEPDTRSSWTSTDRTWTEDNC